jgi:hypothetical protein
MSIEDELLQAEARRRGMSETRLRMLLATGDGLMADIVADGRRASPAKPSSIIPEKAKPGAGLRPGSNGWVASRPLQGPSGVGARGNWSHQRPKGEAE